MVEYLLSRGVTQAISCPDIEMAEYASRTGWRVKHLGNPRRYPEGGVAVAIVQPVSQEEVTHLRARFGRRDFFLVEVPADAPWATLPLPVIEREYLEVADRASSNAELNALADARLRGQVNA